MWSAAITPTPWPWDCSGHPGVVLVRIRHDAQLAPVWGARDRSTCPAPYLRHASRAPVSDSSHIRSVMCHRLLSHVSASGLVSDCGGSARASNHGGWTTPAPTGRFLGGLDLTLYEYTGHHVRTPIGIGMNGSVRSAPAKDGPVGFGSVNNEVNSNPTDPRVSNPRIRR
jgi:hypothetical protein